MAERTVDNSPAVNRERRQQIRQQRRDQDEQQHQRERRRDIMLMVGAVIVVLALAAGLAYYLYQQSNIQMGDEIADEGREHVAIGTPVTYQHNPPASGTHFPQAQPYGVYDAPVLEGFWVHNLEHGGVVLLFACDGDACKQTADQIRPLFEKLPKSRWDNVKFVAVPYTKTDSQMTTPFMLVAWDRQLPLQTLDESIIQTFYKAYVDKGPENVP